MSPREKHIPEHAQRTSVCLTAEERAAIHWISEARRARKDRRTTINDILVDALWYFLERAEGKTKDQMRAMIPGISVGERAKGKVTEMPKPRRLKHNKRG
jgi:hypothetical protein